MKKLRKWPKCKTTKTLLFFSRLSIPSTKEHFSKTQFPDLDSRSAPTRHGEPIAKLLPIQVRLARGRFLLCSRELKQICLPLQSDLWEIMKRHLNFVNYRSKQHQKRWDSKAKRAQLKRMFVIHYRCLGFVWEISVDFYVLPSPANPLIAAQPHDLWNSCLAHLLFALLKDHPKLLALPNVM